MSRLKDVIGAEKVIIVTCHLQAMPGDLYHDAEKGMDWVVEKVKEDLCALQDGGVDVVMFSNELSLPRLTRVRTETMAIMARVIRELKPFIKVPLGVNVLWDPIAPLDLAIAAGALFVREIMSGVYASDFGLRNTNTGETARYQDQPNVENAKLFYNIVPEVAKYLAGRDIKMVAGTTVFNCCLDAICVSGATVGSATDVYVLSDVKNVLSDTAVIANTGCRKGTIEGILKIADAVVVGTVFKYDGGLENQVDVERVKESMEVVRMARAS